MVAYFWYTFRVAGKQYRFILLLQSVNLLDLYVEWYWFFSGQEDFKQTSLRNSLAKLGELPFVFLFVKSPDDLWKYVLYIPLATFILSVSYLPLLKERLVPVPKRDLHPFAAMYTTPAGTIIDPFPANSSEIVVKVGDESTSGLGSYLKTFYSYLSGSNNQQDMAQAIMHACRFHSPCRRPNKVTDAKGNTTKATI